MKRFLISVSVLMLTLNVCAQIDEVLQQIEQNNFSLQALNHTKDADVLDVKAENRLQGPSIEYSPFWGVGRAGVAESELVVREEIEFPTKYAARNKQACLTQAAGHLQLSKLKREVLLEAELLCLDIIRLNQTLQLLEQRLAGSTALRGILEKRMEAGDANMLELNKVNLDCMEVKTLVCEAENERTLLQHRLQQMNGGKEIELSATMFPTYEAITDFESFCQLMMTSDADILLAETEVKRAAQDVNIQQQQWLPNLSLGYRRNTDAGEMTNGFLVGVSFPLLGNSTKVKAAKLRQRSAELLAEQTRQERRSLLFSCYQQIASLQQVLDHSDVTMMHESLELYSKALLHGEMTALEYYVEINSIYDKLMRHIEVHCQCAKLQSILRKR
ncbi:MAG: TolC family protein [Bacteroidales bacterium]|nr:TolC family protein [Candidatus Physcousia equi]